MTNTSNLSLSIIIPTLNEEAHLGNLLVTLLDDGVLAENIFIADGGSTDRTKEIAQTFQVNFIQTPEIGRAQQMNHVANMMNKEWLYFIHADTLPPKGFLSQIEKSIDNGAEAGSFRSSFDSNNIFLSVNAFFTRFSKLWCRGGDQTIFVKKSLFDSLGEFCEECIIMEDYDLIEKLQATGKFDVMQKSAIISTRKYQNRSYWKVMRANFVAFRMYKKREPWTEIQATYQELLGK